MTPFVAVEQHAIERFVRDDYWRQAEERRLLVRNCVRVPAIRLNTVDPPLASVQTPLQQLSDLEPHSTVDLGVPIGARPVVELDVPVPGLHHDQEPTR